MFQKSITCLSLVFVLALGAKAQPVAASLDEANRLFTRAKTELNALNYELALSLFAQCEPGFKQQLHPHAAPLVELLCLMALCHLKLEDAGTAARYLNQLAALAPQVSGLSKAHILYVQGSAKFVIEKDYPLAQTIYQEALNLYLKEPGVPHLHAARIYNNFALLQRASGHYTQALPNFETSLRLFQHHLGDNHPHTAAAYDNRGLVYADQGLYDRAIQDYQKSLSIRYRFYQDLYHRDLITPHLNLGLAYAYKGDWDRADDYLNLSLEAMLRNKVTQYLSYVYTNLGVVQGRKNNPAAEREYYIKALELESLTADSTELATTNFNISYTYRTEARFSEAKVYAEKAIDLAGDQHPMKSRFLSNLGLIYQGMRQLEKAKSIFRQALTYSLQSQGAHHPFVAYAYMNLAAVQLQQDSLAASLRNNTLAQQSLHYQAGQNFRAVSSLRDLCPALTQQALIQTRMAKLRPSTAAFQQVLAATKQSLAAFDSLRISLRGDEAKSTVAAGLSATLEMAYAANHHAWRAAKNPVYLQSAFQIAERSKATLLLEAMRNAELRAIPNVPGELLQREIDLRWQITTLEKNRQELLNSNLSLTDADLREVKNELATLNQQYEALIQVFKNQYPDLYNAQFNLKVLTIEDVQQKILRNE